MSDFIIQVNVFIIKLILPNDFQGVLRPIGVIYHVSFNLLKILMTFVENVRLFSAIELSLT